MTKLDSYTKAPKYVSQSVLRLQQHSCFLEERIEAVDSANAWRQMDARDFRLMATSSEPDTPTRQGFAAESLWVLSLWELIEKHSREWVSWKAPRRPTLVIFARAVSDDETINSTPDDTQHDWFSSAEEILTRLDADNTTWQDRITAILFAETTAFDETQKPRLLNALYNFAINHRFTQDDETTTAVGAAIRKFAMNMPPSELDAYSRLFLPTDTNTLSCTIELELVKAVGWRLSQLTRQQIGKPAELIDRLSELASDYLTPRLILQKNYATIVIHAVIAVALLNGPRQDEFIDRISNLQIEWFRELFARRWAEVVSKQESVDDRRASELQIAIDRLKRTGV